MNNLWKHAKAAATWTAGLWRAFDEWLSGDDDWEAGA